MGRLMQKFWDKVVKDSITGCYIWIGAKNSKEYGFFNDGKKVWRANRFIWVQTNGAIPDDMILHHACPNKPCVNVGHMELKLKKIHDTENKNSPSGLNSIKTHCPKGHEYSGSNLYMAPENDRTHKRRCRECMRIARRIARANKKLLRIA